MLKKEAGVTIFSKLLTVFEEARIYRIAVLTTVVFKSPYYISLGSL